MTALIEEFVYKNQEELYVNAVWDSLELTVAIKDVLTTVIITEFALIRNVIVKMDLVEILVI